MDDLDRLARDFDDAGDDAMAKARKVVRASTLKGEALGKAKAPKLTGFMASSITSEFSGDANTSRGETGPEADYSHFVEMGTSRMAPQPFMGPAADVVEPEFFAALDAIGGDVLGGVNRDMIRANLSWTPNG